jgi:hypothetical protein
MPQCVYNANETHNHKLELAVPSDAHGAYGGEWPPYSKV